MSDILPDSPPSNAPEWSVSELSQALKRLDILASVLHTGAHPDDENSALLAWLSRGQGARFNNTCPIRKTNERLFRARFASRVGAMTVIRESVP